MSKVRRCDVAKISNRSERERDGGGDVKPTVVVTVEVRLTTAAVVALELTSAVVVEFRERERRWKKACYSFNNNGVGD